MSAVRSFVSYILGIVTALVLLFGTAVSGQDADENPLDESEESEEVEEIIVVAPKLGDRVRVDQVYEDPMRARLLRDLYEMEIIEEEYEWRKSAAVESPSRFKWGYDPRDDYVRRNEIDLLDMDSDKTKPATLFRFEP